MRRLLILFLAAAALLGLAACSTDQVTVAEGTAILDVRSPAEFGSGHLEGATLLDLNSGELAAALPGLDPTAEYVVYCRSGSRSGQAVSLMQRAGFENVTDLGSVNAASASTGLDIVK